MFLRCCSICHNNLTILWLLEINVFRVTYDRFFDEIIVRDKTSLDITWLKDKSLADLDNLPDPDVLAGDIIENLESAVESFKEIMITINGK